MSTHMNTCEWPNCCSYQRDTEYGRVLYTPSVDNVEQFPLWAIRRLITKEKGSFALRLPRIPWTYYKTGPVVAKRGLRCEPLARVVQDDSTTYYSVLAAANPCFPPPPPLSLHIVWLPRIDRQRPLTSGSYNCRTNS
jgi:hypothetical protein